MSVMVIFGEGEQVSAGEGAMSWIPETASLASVVVVGRLVGSIAGGGGGGAAAATSRPRRLP